MRVLHFTGEGKGWMKGIEEYVIVTDETVLDSPIEDEIAPGFKLESETEIEDLPHSFPTETMLVPQK